MTPFSIVVAIASIAVALPALGIHALMQRHRPAPALVRASEHTR